MGIRVWRTSTGCDCGEHHVLYIDGDMPRGDQDLEYTCPTSGEAVPFRVGAWSEDDLRDGMVRAVRRP